MATVYLAVQENFERDVAIKVMSSALAEDEAFSERFLREARIVSRLIHPNIVTVHDVGIHEGHHYLAMEYIPGKDLKHVMAGMSGKDILRMMKELAAALDYAGKKGYVHRDVKPENIMINEEDGRAVLMDFGIARAADGDNNMTKTGIALGTPYYMSPEQARGKPVDGRSDLYALGVVFYLMLMNKVPYDAESAIAIGIKHISDPIPRLPPAIADLQGLIDRLMAKKPDARFQTGNELVEALEDVDPQLIDDWRTGLDVEHDAERQDTPVRADQLAPDSLPNDIVADRGKTRAQRLSIPAEDIKQRQQSQAVAVKKPRSLLAPLLLVLLLSIVAGYYVSFGPQFPPPPQEVNRLAQQFGLQPIYPLVKEPAPPAAQPEVISQPEPSQVTESLAADPATIESAEPVISEAEARLNRMLNESRVLAAQVMSQPELKSELILSYQQILLEDPEQAEAIEGIARIIDDTFVGAEQAIADKELEQARDSLLNLAALLPDVEADERFAALQQEITKQEQINALLSKAEVFFNTNQLTQGQGGNAFESYQEVLAIDAQSQTARQGLDKIVGRYLQFARSARSKKEFASALSYIKSGLQVEEDNADLIQLRAAVQKEQRIQRQVEQLVKEGREFQERGLLFDKQDSAGQRYLAALALDPKAVDAKSAIAAMKKSLMIDIRVLIADNQFEQAQTDLVKAMNIFSDDEELAKLLFDIESKKPAISKILLSGRAISSMDTLMPEAVSAERTLHIALQYQHFFKETTVIQAILYDGSRAVQIAAIPVIVSGRSGISRFRIDRPVEAFAEGGYHIDILLDGKLLITRAFSVAR